MSQAGWFFFFFFFLPLPLLFLSAVLTLTLKSIIAFFNIHNVFRTRHERQGRDAQWTA